jgi:predicted transcriptional regulator
MVRNNIFGIENEFEKRKIIFDYIKKYPGSHNREISRKLNIPKTTLLYHLNYLKKKGLINEKEDGGYSRYFKNGDLLEFDKELYTILRKRIYRDILYVLSYHRVLTQIEIVKYLKDDFNIKKHPTTIAFHLEKLLDLGIIECVPNGREKLYMGNYKSAHLVVDFLLKQKLSFFSDYLIWHLHRLNKPSKIWFEKAEDVFLQVFPHPYHV